MKKQTGITLIALIITIIVLLILAGVTINLTLGEKGIFKTAQRAVQNYKDAQDQELTYLNYFEAEMNNTISGLGTSSVAGGSTSQTPTTPPTPPPGPYQAYNVGDTVTLNNNGTQETFYVIKQSSSNESTLTLLAKNCINTTTLKQSVECNDIEFANSAFWADGSVFETLDVNTLRSPEGVTTAVDIARAYGNEINASATGRLMTYNEALNLETLNPDILYGMNGKTDVFVSIYDEVIMVYWLSDVNNEGAICEVNAFWDYNSGESIGNCVGFYGVLGDRISVRPVIEIPKSLI